MAFDPEVVEAVSFDSFSTLVDVDAAAEAISEYTDAPEQVAATWRERAVQYSRVANYIDAYETYFRMHRYGLEYAVRHYDLAIPDEKLDEITEVYYELPAFDDVYESLERLHDAGYDLYIISNGDPAMLDGLVSATGVEPFLTDMISADEIRTFKPDASIYRLASERADRPPDRIAHVSAGIVDVLGAKHVGMQGVWLNRKALPPEPFGSPPDLTVSTLPPLVDRLV